MTSTETILSAAIVAIAFGAAVIASPASAHGPGSHGPSNNNNNMTNSNRPTTFNAPKNFGSKIKTATNSGMHEAMRHRRGKNRGANDIDPGENDDVCKWTKKNGHDAKVCSSDDE